MADKAKQHKSCTNTRSLSRNVVKEPNVLRHEWLKQQKLRNEPKSIRQRSGEQRRFRKVQTAADIVFMAP